MRSLSPSLLVFCLVLIGSNVQAYESDNLRHLRQMSDGFAEIAAQVKPGVVKIVTEGTASSGGATRSEVLPGKISLAIPTRIRSVSKTVRAPG